MNTNTKLYNHALQDFNLREVPGSGSNPRIRKAIDLSDGEPDWLNQDDSKTAWCGCIMGLWCKELNLPTPKEYYRAASWKTVGKPVLLSEAKQGDIIVMSRSGGKHVTLFSRLSGDVVYCLGGNQSNQVNVTGFNKGFVEEVRRLD